MITVHMKDVGRNKRSWTAKIRANPLDLGSIETAVEREVRQSGALLSRDIVAQMDTPDGGMIFAGFHSVGRFEVAEGEQP